MSTLNLQRPLPFELGSADKRLFELDGRCVEFPEGLKTADFTHTIHRFPGKFVPQVARELLHLVGATDRTLIADPFCGSGTSLVEASLLGVPAMGVDFDPLAILISHAKTVALSEKQITTLGTYWSGALGVCDYHDLTAAVPNLHHWFTPEIAGQLAFIKRKAMQLHDDALRLFSLVVFSSVIRRVSNADDQTQKTYVSGTLRKTPPTPVVLFPFFMEKAIRGMASYSACERAPVLVERGDARNWSGPAAIDAIITSPPYIDSIDYVYNQMLEYFWLYDVLGLASVDEVRALRKEPIGFRRSDVASGLERMYAISTRAGELLAPVLATIQSASKKEAENVVGYFEDFAKHIEATKKILRRGGVYSLVIGESHIRGVTVPTPTILAALFESSGFEDMGSCSYVIKRHYMKFPRRSNSGKINIDYVCCFRNR
jgi:hypothetical protein